MNQFSKNLRARRKFLNLTQQDIALELNVSNKAISKWETGECLPETSQLLPLAKLLGVTVDELLGGSGEEKGVETILPTVSKNITVVEKRRKPWRKFLISALCTAVFGVIVFFLFLIAFSDSYGHIYLWALGVLLTFLVISLIFLVIAFIIYCINLVKDGN